MYYGYGYYYDPTIILVIIGAIISGIASMNVQRTYKKYSRVRNYRGLTSNQVAEHILHAAGIYDVRIERIRGNLTDHYSPKEKVLRLSDAVYGQTSVAALGVAAHECGHAVQHAMSYGPLTLRSKLVPVVSATSRWMTWILLGGMLLLSYTGNPYVLGVGVVLYALTTIFSLVTLPVEIDASRRAVKWLDSRGLTDTDTHNHAVSALRAAAYTYVVAALSSLATLFYYILMLLNNRR